MFEQCCDLSELIGHMQALGKICAIRATTMYLAKLVQIARTHSTDLLLSLAAQCVVHRVGPPWGINKVQPSTKPIQSIMPSSFLSAAFPICSRFVLFYFIWAFSGYLELRTAIQISCTMYLYWLQELLSMDCFCLTLLTP